MLGAGVSYLFISSHYSQPYRLRSPVKLVLGVASFPIIFFTAQYLGYYNRFGSNTYISNLYTNNLWRENAHRLMNNFYVFNRKFTEEEMAQFNFNRKLQVRGPKAYHYNEKIHGEEEMHKARHEAWNRGEKYLDRYSRN